MRTLYRMHEIGGDPPDPPQSPCVKSLGRIAAETDWREANAVAGPLPQSRFSVVPGFSCLANTRHGLIRFVQ